MAGRRNVVRFKLPEVKRRRAREYSSSSSGSDDDLPLSSTSGELEDEESPNHVYERKFFWSHYTDSGFPHRVNHAVCSCQDSRGDSYLHSLGGYHADDDERTVIQADTIGGPFFKRSPIDVHCLDVDHRTWTRCDPPEEMKFFNTGPYSRAKIPGCRYGHTVCQYRGKIYMYGGRNDEDGSFSKTECYDIASGIWLNVPCVGERPGSRDGHACTSIGAEMFIHGGFAASEILFSGDLFSFNMSTHTWRKLPKSGDWVPERDFHTATAVNNMIVAFGGRSDVLAPSFTANDVYDNAFYSYNLSSLRWTKRKPTGYQLKGRRSHCAAAFGHSIIYFGGYNALLRQHFGDVFILDTDSWHLSEIRPFGNGPEPRRRVGAALVGTELIICGGTSPTEITRDDRKREVLHDHNDMYILHLLPTLEQLCMMVVIKENMDTCSLPTFLQNQIDVIRKSCQPTVTGIALYESG